MSLAAAGLYRADQPIRHAVFRCEELTDAMRPGTQALSDLCHLRRS